MKAANNADRNAIGDTRTLLDQIARMLELNRVGLAALLQVDTRTLDSWHANGIPKNRQRDIDDIIATVTLLERMLRPGLLPVVARRNTEQGTLIAQMTRDPLGTLAAYEVAFNPSVGA